MLNSVHPLLVFFVGLSVIILGAEWVLRSASRIAAMLGIKPIVIGLTVVAVGTSAPELGVGITAVAEGKGGLAVGNIAGTNIFNILFILGLSAALRPLPLQLTSLRFEIPVMIASALVLLGMAWDKHISRWEGIILIAGAVIYTYFLLKFSRRESPKAREEYSDEYSKTALLNKPAFKSWVFNAVLLIAGMYFTILGAEWLVKGAVDIAKSLHVSDAIIGLTIVAVGTSAPELVTTIVATRRNDRDVAVGNLIGSSISNILLILGITCVVSPQGINVSSDVLWLDLPFGAAVAIMCYPVFRSDRMISQREGIFFVCSYLVYMATLILLRT